MASDSLFQEKLGKRESSRFSHKAIVIDPELSVARKLTIFRNSLLVDGNFPNCTAAAKWNTQIEQLCTNDIVLESLKQCEDMREGDFRNSVLVDNLLFNNFVMGSIRFHNELPSFFRSGLFSAIALKSHRLTCKKRLRL